MLINENKEREIVQALREDNNNEVIKNAIDDVLFEDFDKKLKEEKANLNVSLEKAVHDYQQNGIVEAFDYIFGHYKPILDRLAYRKNDEDLSQELSEVLWHAVQKFDATAGVRFNTFFWKCAQNHMGTQNIRKNAQKRSGSKKIETTVINEETGLEETVTEIFKTKVVSLQTTLNSQESESELGNFVESLTFKNQYVESDLMICLNQMHESGLIKTKEFQAIGMIMEDATLVEIGEKLNGVTAPAIHVMLRRLGDKKQVKKRLLEILT